MFSTSPVFCNKLPAKDAALIWWYKHSTPLECGGVYIGVSIDISPLWGGDLDFIQNLGLKRETNSLLRRYESGRLHRWTGRGVRLDCHGPRY